jgi:sigma-B regulation protein RsbU (phosphoserine phosphatase)
MTENHPTGLFHLEPFALGRDIAGRFFPRAARNNAALDYYGESQLAGTAGGDFFDFIPYEPNALIAIMGHVSGQSTAAAALLIPGLRDFLRTRLPGEAGNLRGVVRDLNRTICDTAPDAFYAALFSAVIDVHRRELYYINAGHEPALLVRGGEQVYRLEGTGTVLGLTTRAAYGLRSITLEPGDLLVIFSEGIADAAGKNGEPFGTTRLIGTLREKQGERSSVLVAEVMNAVRRFATGTNTGMDRSLAVVRFNGVAAHSLVEDEEETEFAAA